MSTAQKQLSIGMNILGFGSHSAAWRVAEVPADSLTNVEYFKNIARISEERGTLDAIFLADSPVLHGNIGENASGRPEPTVLLTAVASATSRIGVISTVSTSYNEPFNVARRIASVDHISGGRAAWNIVTGQSDVIARNFNQEHTANHAERYARADEFVDVVLKLWDSWEDDAIIGDAKNGVWADAAKVHEINHRGKYFQVRGPLNLPRTPQGRPLLVQAGSSEEGKYVGSRYADAIFTTQTTLEAGQAFYREMKARARNWGRNPDHIKIMPGLSTVIGSTEAEAQARFDRLNAIIGEKVLLNRIAQRIGLSPDALDPDAPLPVEKIGPVTQFQNSHGFIEANINLARGENLTVRQLARRILVGHRLLVGTPEQVADTIEHWFRVGAADGFNIMPDVFPSGVEAFVDGVVPILRKRGIFRHEYTGTTLREHLGLPFPESRYKQPELRAA
ncbi:MAG: LLM class flavin-dependent oxidoreductase [Zoogloeaceae bacterium]|jgi:FMN-dependent oxidoreductase (nitrilotriacetate monooxygenase family)|nr:LLM class flavin-dependent oxidoreductase [Zoogloeaceae bacterium]